MDDSQFAACLQEIRKKGYLRDINSIHELCISGEIRDFTLDTYFYESLFVGLRLCWATRDEGAEWLLLQVWAAAARLPEFDTGAALQGSAAIRIQSVFKRLEWGGSKNAALVVGLLAWLYARGPSLRGPIRKELGRWLEQQRLQGERIKHAHMQPVLQFLSQIIGGMGVEGAATEEARQETRHVVLAELLEQLLLPLHLENGMLEWRDQVPIIKPYHESLVICIVRCIHYEQRAPQTPRVDSFLCRSVLYLLNNWPESFNANTPKEVLFIHEMEQLLAMASKEEFAAVVRPVLKRLSLGLNHDNALPLQRTLQCFKNDRLFELMTPHLELIVSELLRPLYRGGELFWNPTVNKMTALVLQKFLDADKEVVIRCANRMNLGASAPIKKVQVVAAEQKHDGDNAVKAGDFKQLLPPTMRPPIGKSISRALPRAPPAAAKGLMAGWSPGQGAPPVTITGVAPWAQPQQMKGAAAALLGAKPVRTPSHAHRPEIDASTVKDEGANAVQHLKAYILRCLGKSADDKSDEQIDWLAAQAAPTPTLLPELKFHQLVFGKELGRGAFSIVKYARHVQPHSSRSRWPEYAVKVMSKSVLEGQGRGFQQATVREIVVLSALSHPGVTRLISAFRYTDSIYLVLEYAAAGDLHSYVVTHGALDHTFTRFVIGEVGAALVSIHDLGLSFNDLKPENIVITENGHVKLTDFGACRPVNESGEQLLLEKNKQLVGRSGSDSEFSFFECLRDGDWRVTAREQKDCVGHSEDMIFDSASYFTNDKECEGNDDASIEGTPGYLPPEVLQLGGLPDQLSDSWALGCTLEFCLSGRPPFYGHTEQVLHQIEMRCSTERRDTESAQHGGVHFDVDIKSSGVGTKRSRWIDDSKCDSTEDVVFNTVLDGLLSRLICVDVKSRTTISEALKNPYFTGEGIRGDITNPLQLHAIAAPPRLPKLDAAIEGADSAVSASSSSGDKEWARRQLSSVWAPMPKTYDFSQQHLDRSSGKDIQEGATIVGNIVESPAEKCIGFLPPPVRLLPDNAGVILETCGESECCEDHSL